MPLPHDLDELFHHMHWADSVVWRAALAAPEAQGDERIHHLLFHLHQVQHAFLSVWRGEETPSFRDFSAYPDLPSLVHWAREYHEQVAVFLAGVRAEQLSEPKEVTWKRWVEKAIGRAPAVTTFGETMLQVSQHSTYHRGQVNLRLRDVGVTPPLTDFIAWVWMGKPNAEWPS